MHIHPSQATVSSLLMTGTYEVPPYQRNYAWGELEVDAFLKDLDQCRLAMLAGHPKHHFFGGVVTAASPVLGSSRQNLQLIDGQQRLATFMLLLSHLRRTMRRLAMSEPAPPEELRTFLDKQADLLANQYETYTDTINLTIVTVPRVRLSKVDQPLFELLIAGNEPIAEKASHVRLIDASARIQRYLDEIAARDDPPDTKVRGLSAILQVIQTSWTVIHMAAQSRADAYMLFQVLNDRGLGLTEGELLRAAVLEALDPIASGGEMAAAEASWDAILNIKDTNVREVLRWVHASQMGAFPGSNTLLVDMQENLFPILKRSPLQPADATELLASLKSLQRDVAVANKLLNAEWPMNENQAVYAWDKDRLRLLAAHLHQTDTLPLLIAATLLEPAPFAELVHLLERFCFRYSIVVDAPRRDMIGVFHRHAVEVRRDPLHYDPRTLARELRDLLALHAPDDVFSERLATFRYPRGGESRKPLKYLLMTLEHYVRWFDEGAQGKPVCRDRTRIFDFESSTIEHIYAENAEQPDAQLEPLVDDLGNLTILSPQENDAAGAKAFEHKRRYLAASTSTLNKQIAELPAWTSQAVQQRRQRLVAIALRAFNI